MATDYGKKTNADLVEILKSRSLAHTGKKADLVARLQEDDAKNTAAPAETKADTAAEDVIDWDDDVPAEAANATTEAGATAIAAGGKGAVANPVAVPNQKLDIDPAATDDLKVESTGATDAAQPEAAVEEEKKPAVDYTRELEEELKKRKARAEKFGIVEDHETAVKEAEKQLSRAKRFGTGAEAESGSTVGVHGLDQALPDEKSRKRGPKDQGGRGDKRRDMGRNRNRNRNGRADGRGDGRGNGVQKRTGGGNAASGRPKSNWSEKESAAMEARKKRFAQAA
ncbi:unnamed protein product [Penicillium manginii]